jgi:hypothetical protein
VVCSPHMNNAVTTNIGDQRHSNPTNRIGPIALEIGTHLHGALAYARWRFAVLPS